MAWIDALTLTVRRSEQVYTQLSPHRFRFQSGDFDTEITVDEEGLVIDYPGLFARM